MLVFTQTTSSRSQKQYPLPFDVAATYFCNVQDRSALIDFLIIDGYFVCLLVKISKFKQNWYILRTVVLWFITATVVKYCTVEYIGWYSFFSIGIWIKLSQDLSYLLYLIHIYIIFGHLENLNKIFYVFHIYTVITYYLIIQ
jgi:hypothetical protein